MTPQPPPQVISYAFVPELIKKKGHKKNGPTQISQTTTHSNRFELLGEEDMDINEYKSLVLGNPNNAKQYTPIDPMKRRKINLIKNSPMDEDAQDNMEEEEYDIDLYDVSL